MTDLDPVRKMRVMAAATPGSALVERVIPAPFDAVWAVIADLEGEMPHYQPAVKRVQVDEGDGDRLRVIAYGRAAWLSADFEAVLRPGWCWMQSRNVTFGLAAVPVSGGTLVARAGSSRRPLVGRLAAPLLRLGFAGELARLERRALAR